MVVSHDKTYEKGYIIVEDEKIVDVGHHNKDTPDIPPFPLENFDEVIDAKGMVCMPGGVDPHTHLEMDLSKDVQTVDNFFDGTACAALGGTTMIIDYAAADSNNDYCGGVDVYHEKAAKCAVDYSFHIMVHDVHENTEEQLVRLKQSGVTTVKYFLAYPDRLMLRDDAVFKLLDICAKHKLLPQLHAENGALVDRGRHEIAEVQGILSPQGHVLSRLPHCEVDALVHGGMAAIATKTPLYVVHNSCGAAAEAITMINRMGGVVVGECTAAHLALDWTGAFSDDFATAAAHIFSPPLRKPETHEEVKGALFSDEFIIVATDHCAFSTEQRMPGRHDFRKMPNGAIGLEERMTIVWTLLVEEMHASYEKFVQWTSYNACKILGIPNKGAIEVGYDADIVIWDRNKYHTLSAKTHRSNVDVSPWEGFKCRGKASTVLSRGKVIVRNEELVNDAEGHGKFVPRGVSPLFNQL
ncbi:hypothetical protein PCE1_001858 [Barthelona sp. PCE]